MPTNEIHLRRLATTATDLASWAQLPYSADLLNVLRPFVAAINANYTALVVQHRPGPPANPRPWYQVLGLSPEAGPNEVKAAAWTLSHAGTVPTNELLHAVTEGLAAFCPVCQDELREDGTCGICHPTCTDCYERPCICPPEPDGEPSYASDGLPY